jgi:hypothetical protein
MPATVCCSVQKNEPATSVPAWWPGPQLRHCLYLLTLSFTADANTDNSDFQTSESILIYVRCVLSTCMVGVPQHALLVYINSKLNYETNDIILNIMYRI